MVLKDSALNIYSSNCSSSSHNCRAPEFPSEIMSAGRPWGLQRMGDSNPASWSHPIFDLSHCIWSTSFCFLGGCSPVG